jgi:hypothetical protein
MGKKKISEIKKKTKEIQIKKNIEVKELKEESKLEEEIEESEEDTSEESFEGRRFHFGSPSLRRINISPETIVNLETELKDVPVSSSSEDEGFKYSAGTGSKDEPKYINYSNPNVLQEINRVDMAQIGKKEERREVGFMSSSESTQGRTDFERYEKVKRVDRENLGRNEERREIKYEPPR